MRRRIEVDPRLEPVAIPSDVLNEVFAHAREADPEECCGLIVGNARDRYREAVRCRNDMTLHHRRDPKGYPRDGRQAFYMNELDYQKAEEQARARGEWVTAVYHSHVGCGAYFSELDQDYAGHEFFPFPDAEHLVVAVIGRKVVEQAIYRLDARAGGFVGRTVVNGAP